MNTVCDYYPSDGCTVVTDDELARSEIVRNSQEPHAITYCEIESVIHERLRFMRVMCGYIEDEG